MKLRLRGSHKIITFILLEILSAFNMQLYMWRHQYFSLFGLTCDVICIFLSLVCRSCSRWLITRSTAALANSCQPQTMSRRGASAASEEVMPSSTPPSNENPDCSTDNDRRSPSRWAQRKLTRYRFEIHICKRIGRFSGTIYFFKFYFAPLANRQFIWEVIVWLLKKDSDKWLQ